MAIPYVETWNISKEDPQGHAEYNNDEGCYECTNPECRYNHALLVECGGISNQGCYFRPIDEFPEDKRPFPYYTPILRCTGCGRVYFGNITRPPRGLPVVRKTAEERIAELEERITRLEEALADLMKNRERPAIRAKAQQKQSPNQDEDYIILPSIMTV